VKRFLLPDASSRYSVLLTPPNVLTLSRIAIIPLLILAFYFIDGSLSHRIAAALFLIASITDFLDGYLARIWHMQSNFGRFLDPIADKLLVGAIMLVMVDARKADIIPAIAIICREILVSGLREFLAELHVSVPVSKMAKVKTAMQMTAIFLLLLGDKGSGILYTDLLGRITLWGAAILTLVTGFAYLDAGFAHMNSTDKVTGSLFEE
jgi:cardiolipin synthase